MNRKDIESKIEVNDENEMPGRDERYMWYTCRHTENAWIDTAYVVSAEPVSTADDFKAYDWAEENELLTDEDMEVWRVEDPNVTEYYATKEQAIEAMLDLAEMYYEAEE